MTVRLLQKLFLAVTLLIGVARPSLAHVIWFPTAQGQYDLWLSEFEDSASLPYDTSGSHYLKALDGSGNEISANVSSANNSFSLTPNANPAALKAFYDRGFWIRDDSVGFDVDHDDGKYLGYLTPAQLAAQGYSNVVQHLSFTKALYQWSSALGQPFGQELEIFPLTNPFLLQTGDYLPIKVLFQGQQVINDVTLLYLDQPILPDVNGIFNVPIGIEGLQPIEADYFTDETINSPLTYYAASLTASTVPEPSSLLGILGVGGLMVLVRRHLR